MNTRNLLIASLVGGLISLVLVNTPFLNLINLLACMGFWAGPIAAVWLYRRLSGELTLGEAAIVGMVAGAWHGLIGVLLSPLGLAGVQGLLQTAQIIVPAADAADLEPALSGLGTVLFNLFGVLFDVVFGLLGGMVGGLLLSRRRASA